MAKQSIKTEININAKPEAVWNVLTDFFNYPQWNPFIISIEGNVETGKRIHVKLQGMNFKPKVLVFEQNKEFRWLGHLWIKGLFDGEHRFQLVENADGTTTFIHSENFSGILVKLFTKMLKKNTEPGFKQMNQKLKERVEQIA